MLLAGCKNRNTDMAVVDHLVEEVIRNPEMDTSIHVRLQLDPPDGSVYLCRSKNTTSYELKLEDREIKNSNTADVEYHYVVRRDSSGSFSIDMAFDSIKVLSQTDDAEIALDAANAILSVNPVERMLGMLKDQPVKIRLSGSGIVESITGHEELKQKFLSKFAEEDTYGKTVAKEQWDKMVTHGLIKAQLSQLFKAVPDSPVYRGFSWKLKEKAEGEFPVIMETTLKIKSIDPDGQIEIVSKSDLKSGEEVMLDVSGQNGVRAKLSGYRKGILRVNTKTGIIEHSEFISDMSGTMLVFGTPVPVKIKNKIKLEGIRKQGGE